MKRGLKDMGFGASVAFILSGVLFAAYSLFLALSVPVPYKDVFIREQRMVDDSLWVTATFIKTDCVRDRVNIIGYDLGETLPLPWETRDPPQDDALLGFQTRRFVIGNVVGLDQVQIRVRHKCGDQVVDSTFAALDPREVITPDNPQPARGGHLSPVVNF